MGRKKQIKAKEFTAKMKRRLLFVFLFVCAVLMILAFVLIRINWNKGEDYSKAVYDNYTYDSKTIMARRGDITDRNGIVLAYSTRVYNLILDTKVMLAYDDAKEPTIDALCTYFGLDRNELTQYVEENENKSQKSTYKRLINGLTEEQITEFKTKMEEKGSKIKGVWFEDEYKRNYPYGATASKVIGFASEANGGEVGIERQYERELAGVNGRSFGYINNSNYESTNIPATNGNTIVSTIDINIQNMCEKALLQFQKDYGFKDAQALVMDPNTGEILAMADFPTFDANAPRDLTTAYPQYEIDEMDDDEKAEKIMELWSNRCVTKIFEPGSVFKTFTIAQALDLGVIKPDTSFECDGTATYNASTILCHGGEGHGLLTTAGALSESCNDALMQIAEKIGAHNFCQYMDIFKFGQKTGIDLPGEEEGLTIKESRMMDVDLATNCFGQNINVTTVQMLSCFASIINGGYYYLPHVVKEISSSSGEVKEVNNKTVITRTLSEKTSGMMKDILRTVVDYGTGGYVYLPGYAIGAKTGTAEKQPRTHETYIVSMMEALPAYEPKVLVYVLIDSPDAEDYATSWAAQMVVKDINKELVPYLNLYADNPDYRNEIYLTPEGATDKDGEPVEYKPVEKPSIMETQSTAEQETTSGSEMPPQLPQEETTTPQAPPEQPTLPPEQPTPPPEQPTMPPEQPTMPPEQPTPPAEQPTPPPAPENQ